MPATVIVGGQFGSEGKGKVAYWCVREQRAIAAIRVGGSNSGHTVVTPEGRRFVLRHLPTAAVLPDVRCIIGPGSYIDIDVLNQEIIQTGLSADRLHVDPNASVITSAHKDREIKLRLSERIGSTQSGTGEAVVDRMRRSQGVVLAKNAPCLEPFVRYGPVRRVLRNLMDRGERVVVEGTQGFGLSVLHADDYPKATSRDTTAAAATAEAALSPRDVDQVVLVIRAFPIRVRGDSGPLPNETSWDRIAAAGGWAPGTLSEYTSVTGALRRVAEFDSEIVCSAIEVNAPTTIVLNHMDYADVSAAHHGALGLAALHRLTRIEERIQRVIDWVGLGQNILRPRDELTASHASYTEVIG